MYAKNSDIQGKSSFIKEIIFLFDKNGFNN